MKNLSVCSGIEAASVAWKPLGWTPVAFSEIERFPRAVLQYRHAAVDAGDKRFYGVPLFGDFTALRVRHFARLGIEMPDVIVGGTPCQAFSVAGKRESMDDARGNLTLAFVRLCNAIDNFRRNRGELGPIVIWENVPGVLSVKDNAFGCFLAALAGSDAPLVCPSKRGRWPGAGMVAGPKRTVAWRTLDAQYFGVAQRRRRVFLVASPPGRPDPGKILFEPEGLRRDTPPSREAGKDFAAVAGTPSQDGSGFTRNRNELDLCIPVAGPMQANGGTSKKYGYGMGQQDWENGYAIPVAYSIQAGATRTNPNSGPDGMGVQEGVAYTIEARKEVQIVAYGGNNTSGPIEVAPAVNAHGGIGRLDFESHTTGAGYWQDGCGTLRAREQDSHENIVTQYGPVAGTLSARHDSSPCADRGQNVVFQKMQVRRLTPVECERLQGFPDDYTKMPRRKKKACPDGPRHKAIGNSMAVPVMRWIGQRIGREAGRLK